VQQQNIGRLNLAKRGLVIATKQVTPGGVEPATGKIEYKRKKNKKNSCRSGGEQRQNNIGVAGSDTLPHHQVHKI
jgi:hypothetical protein